MAHPHHDDARKAHGDKLSGFTGARGEYPPDRAARIAGTKVDGPHSTGDAAQVEEHWVAAPPRQVSDFGRVKGK
jgi:hypothetical protein